MSKLRLMSHNQWRRDAQHPAWEAVGADCSPSVRVRGFARVFSDIQPDIVGIQECSGLMADKLIRYTQQAGMKYALLWGRDTPIVYRPDKFELVDSAFLVYPEEFPGYEGSFNNSKTKSYCIGVFRVKENGKLLIYATTHLWWQGDTTQPGSSLARAYQMDLLIDKVDELQKKYNCPAFVVGDLNAHYDSPAVKAAFNRGFLHTHDIAVEYVNEENGTHFCFDAGFKPYTPSTFDRAIDHILVRNAPEGMIRRFDRFYEEYYMPLSDHHPVFVDIEI